MLLAGISGAICYFVRPSIRQSVCPVRSSNLKAKRNKKKQIGVDVWSTTDQHRMTIIFRPQGHRLLSGSMQWKRTSWTDGRIRVGTGRGDVFTYLINWQVLETELPLDAVIYPAVNDWWPRNTETILHLCRTLLTIS